jgi:hypothetical protein
VAEELPALVVLTVTVFPDCPVVVLVTLNDIVQVLPAAMVPPLRETERLFPATVALVPQPLLAIPDGVVTTMPPGRVSVKPTPVRATLAFLFWIAMVTVEAMLIPTSFGENDLVTKGAETVDTVSAGLVVAGAVLDPAFVVVTAPAAIVLV